MRKRRTQASDTTFLTPSATAVAADGEWKFKLRETLTFSDGTFARKGEITQTVSEAGALDVYLTCPDDVTLGASYRCYPPTGGYFDFILAYEDGSTIQLAELYESGQGVAISALQALLQFYVRLTTYAAHIITKASTTVLGHVKVDGSTITIDGDGVISASGGGGGEPSGPAGGVLAGTYPDPSFAVNMATQTELDAETVSRQTADIALEEDIDSETTARIAADVDLLTNINTRATQAALAAEATTRANADTNIQNNLAIHLEDDQNPHGTTAAQVGADPAGTAAAAMTAHVGQADPHTQYQRESEKGQAGGYAGLDTAQAFTKAQTVQGEAANEATGILFVKDSSGNTMFTIRKSTGFADGRLLLDAGNVSNVPGLRINAMPQGICEKRDWTSGGALELSKDGNGIMQIATNNVRREKVNGASFSSAGLPSFAIEDEGRAAIDLLRLYPGDTANTSKVAAVHRKTSTSSADAGRWNVYFYDTTHATRKAAALLTAIDHSAERTIIEGRADGAQALVGFLGATPVVRQTVSGSRGGNAALASLLTALASLGLITDSSSA